MPGFVIEYHRPSGDRRVHEFLGSNGHREALAYRLALELERTDRDWEIASLNSESMEMLRRTHARYFQGRELQRA
jgi:hypothetical protein